MSITHVVKIPNDCASFKDFLKEAIAGFQGASEGRVPTVLYLHQKVVDTFRLKNSKVIKNIPPLYVIPNDFVKDFALDEIILACDASSG